MAALAANRLVDETLPALVGAHARERRLIGHACGIVVAEKFYVTAERNGREFPARAMAVVEAEQLRAEADRKYHYPDTTPSGDEEMAEFVEEHDEGEHEQKGNEHARSRRSPAN